MTQDRITFFRGEFHFLSNFFHSPFMLGGMTYQTAEHAFQAAKTLDEHERMQVRMAGTPAEAKRMGRGVTLRPGWDDMKLEIMEGVLRAKFGCPTLGDRLTGTAPRELIEGNTWGDRYWGMVVYRGGFTGYNHLGKILMKIRKDFMEQDEWLASL